MPNIKSFKKSRPWAKGFLFSLLLPYSSSANTIAVHSPDTAIINATDSARANNLSCKGALVADAKQAVEVYFNPHHISGSAPVPLIPLNELSTSQRIAFLNTIHSRGEMLKEGFKRALSGKIEDYLKEDPYRNSHAKFQYQTDLVAGFRGISLHGYLTKNEDHWGWIFGAENNNEYSIRDLPRGFFAFVKKFANTFLPQSEADFNSLLKGRLLRKEFGVFWLGSEYEQKRSSYQTPDDRGTIAFKLKKYDNENSYYLESPTTYQTFDAFADSKASSIILDEVKKIDLISNTKNNSNLNSFNFLDKVFIAPLLERIESVFGTEYLLWNLESFNYVYEFILKNTRNLEYFKKASLHLWYNYETLEGHETIESQSALKNELVNRYRDEFDIANRSNFLTGTPNENYIKLMVHFKKTLGDMGNDYTVNINQSVKSLLNDLQSTNDYSPVRLFTFVDHFFAEGNFNYSQLFSQNQDALKDLIRKNLSLADLEPFQRIVKNDPTCKLFHFIEEELPRETNLDISTFTPFKKLECNVKQ